MSIKLFRINMFSLYMYIITYTPMCICVYITYTCQAVNITRPPAETSHDESGFSQHWYKERVSPPFVPFPEIVGSEGHH